MLAVLLVVGLAALTVYVHVVPLFEVQDEVGHFSYVKSVAERRALPLITDASGRGVYHSAAHPPLYFSLSALVTSAISTTDYGERFRYNPHHRLGDPSGSDNRSRVLHGPPEAMPYRDTSLALRLDRALNALFGLTAAAGTWVLARHLLPPGASLLAAGLVVLNPKFVATAAGVNNDALAAALSVWALAALASPLPLVGPRRILAAGLLAGWAILAKTSAVAVVPALLLALAWGIPRARPTAPLAILAAATGAISGWWFGRNWLLYGSLLGSRQWFEALGMGASRSYAWRDFVLELPILHHSYWGIFGWFNVVLARPVYWIYGLVTLLALAGLVGAFRRFPRLRPWLLTLAVWCLFALASYVALNLRIPALTGRLLFPAMGGFAVLGATGLTWLAGALSAAELRVLSLLPGADADSARAEPGPGH